MESSSNVHKSAKKSRREMENRLVRGSSPVSEKKKSFEKFALEDEHSAAESNKSEGKVKSRKLGLSKESSRLDESSHKEKEGVHEKLIKKTKVMDSKTGNSESEKIDVLTSTVEETKDDDNDKKYDKSDAENEDLDREEAFGDDSHSKRKNEQQHQQERDSESKLEKSKDKVKDDETVNVVDSYEEKSLGKTDEASVDFDDKNENVGDVEEEDDSKKKAVQKGNKDKGSESDAEDTVAMDLDYDDAPVLPEQENEAQEDEATPINEEEEEEKAPADEEGMEANDEESRRSAYQQFLCIVHNVVLWITREGIYVEHPYLGHDKISVEKQLAGQEQLEAGLHAFECKYIRRVTMIKDCLIVAVNEERTAIERLYSDLMTRWQKLLDDTLTRKKRLQWIHSQFEPIEKLYLTFAEKASAFSLWLENAKERLTDLVRCNSLDEIRYQREAHTQFRASLSSKEADFQKLVALDRKIKSLNVAPNPHCCFSMESLEDTWLNLQNISEKRDLELANEEESAQRQENNDKARKRKESQQSEQEEDIQPSTSARNGKDSKQSVQ